MLFKIVVPESLVTGIITENPTFLMLTLVPLILDALCLALAIVVMVRRRTKDAALPILSYALIGFWLFVPIWTNSVEMPLSTAITLVGYGFVAVFLGATMLTVSLRLTANGKLDAVDAVTVLFGGFVAGLFTSMAAFQALNLVRPFKSKGYQMFEVHVTTGVSMSVMVIWLGLQIQRVSSKMEREFRFVDQPRWFRILAGLKYVGAGGLLFYFYLWFPYFPAVENIATANMLARALVITGLLGISLVTYYHDLAGLFSLSGREQLLEKGVISAAAFSMNDPGIEALVHIGFNFVPEDMRTATIEYLGVVYVSMLGQGHSYAEGVFTLPVGQYADREAVVFSKQIPDPTAKDHRLQYRNFITIALIYPKSLRGLLPNLATLELRGMQVLDPITKVSEFNDEILRALLENCLLGRLSS